MNRPTPAAEPVPPAPEPPHPTPVEVDSVAGEEDPGAAIDAPAPPPHFNSADKDAERSPPAR